jgi:Bacterial PH domain
MADRQELERAVERDVAGRDARRLAGVVPAVVASLDPQERIVKTASGTWFNDKRCLMVVTRRHIVVADGDRVDPIPFERILSVEYSEGWRKARINIRAQGTAADVKDIHLDSAREINTLIATARRTPAPSARPPA